MQADDTQNQRARPAPWLVGLVLVLGGVRLITAGLVPLTEDEAYYRLWALVPATGYLDHPPMVAWWIAAGHFFIGDTPLGIRAPAILAGLLGAAVLWRTAFVLTNSAKIADRAVLFLQSTLLIGLGGMMITPDAPLVLYWGLALWCLAEWQSKPADARQGWWLLLTGLFAGLGLLSKYSMLFFGAGLVLWFLCQQDRRRWLFSPWLWAGGVFAVALFSPVLVWNATHDWVSFDKQFGRAIADQVTLRYVGEMIGGIFGLLNPLIGLLALLSVRPSMRANLGQAGKSALLLILLTSLPFLLYLFVHVFHSRVQANWPAPLYPGFVLMAAIAAEKARGRLVTSLARLAAPVGIGLSVVLAIHAISPLTTALGRKDPILRTTAGWPALAGEIETFAQEIDADFIATSSYALTGTLAFLLKDGPAVTPLTEPERYLNGAVTPLQQLDIAMTQPISGLYVVLARRDGHDLDAWFRTHRRVAEIPRRARDHVLETYHVYEVTYLGSRP